MIKEEEEDIIIIGAGPVGLALGLLLSKLYMNKKKIIIYEGRSSIVGENENSYPIGINPRSLATFKIIDPILENQMIKNALLIKSWDIYGGNSKVASIESNTVYGITRNTVNTILYQYIINNNINIDIKYNYKLENIDYENKKLYFENKDIVDAKNSRIFACDGVNSVVRNSMNNKGNFKSNMIKWHKEFRVLFQDLDSIGNNNNNNIQLNPDIHYIINGIYVATIRNSKFIQWTAVIGISEDDNDRDLLLSENPSNENILALKAYIKKTAPALLDIFPHTNDEPYRKYFTKRSFNGSIVSVNSLNYKEWIVLLGDAAHSLIPPTGEGINSGCEDVMVLYELMKSNMSTTRITNTNTNNNTTNNNLFESYNTIRYPNIKAIVSLAVYLNENFILKGVDAASRLGFTIIESIIFGKDNYSNDTFGPSSINRVAYNDSITKFHNRKKVLLPCCYCCCYSCYCLSCCWIKDVFTNNIKNTKTHSSNNIIHTRQQTMER